MANRGEGKKKRGLVPVDVSEVIEGLQLGIGQAAALCGVSVRQLSYWTDKGIIQPVDEDRSRTYDFAGVEKVCLIKQALDQGFSLEGAVQEAEAFIRRRDEEQKRLEQLSEADLEQLILQQANGLQQLAERIRREIRTYRVSGDLGAVAASLTGVERLIAFFEANPYTVNTARQIALRVGREVTEVENELDLLEQKKFIQKISYPGSDVYRYVPQRRH